jgi:hypothetical protein
MTFKEAFAILKEKYGESAVLSLSVYAKEDLTPAVFAHGGGKCVSGSTYESVIAQMEAETLGESNNPPEEDLSEIAAIRAQIGGE